MTREEQWKRDMLEQIRMERSVAEWLQTVGWRGGIVATERPMVIARIDGVDRAFKVRIEEFEPGFNRCPVCGEFLLHDVLDDAEHDPDSEPRPSELVHRSTRLPQCTRIPDHVRSIMQ